MTDLQLPAFPRPDLPGSHPENYPTLKIRVLRRLGLPDDGGLWISDAIDSDVLRSYGGIVIEDNAGFLLIEFASLSGAVSWAEGITETGADRTMVALLPPVTAPAPSSPYVPAVIRVTLR
jgi:hypothetical protein